MPGLAITSQRGNAVVVAASGQFLVLVVAVSDHFDLFDLFGFPLLGIRHGAPSYVDGRACDALPLPRTVGGRGSAMPNRRYEFGKAAGRNGTDGDLGAPRSSSPASSCRSWQARTLTTDGGYTCPSPLKSARRRTITARTATSAGSKTT